MGLVGKVSRSRLIQPLEAPRGSWLEAVTAEWGVIDSKTALNLALYRALIEADPGEAESYYVFSNEKQIHTVATSMRSKRSVVRADANGLRLTCGAPGHGWFTADWTLQVLLKPASAINVSQWRSVGDVVPNADFLRKTRDTLALVLQDGPGKINVTSSGPGMDSLIQKRVLSENTPFYGDHLIPVPDVFHDGAYIGLPASSYPAVSKAIVQANLPQWAGAGPGEGYSLDGGRGMYYCGVELSHGAGQPRLVLHLPAEGDVSRQRTFHAAMRCLDRLALTLRETAPDAAAAITGYIHGCVAERQDARRFSQFQRAWGEDAPAGVITLNRGTALPLVFRVRTSASGGALDSYMNISCAWLICRERSWSQGLRAKKREENRNFTLRGPSQVLADGSVKRVFRYGEHGAAAFEKHCFTDDRTPWFWQVNGMYSPLEDGRTEAVFSITSLSRSEDVICYGQELARFLSAAEWQIRLNDPSAEFQTISLLI